MVDICINIDLKTFFGPLYRLTKFFNGSSKMINVNTKNSKIVQDKLRKLHKVAESNIKLWSRHKALRVHVYRNKFFIFYSYKCFVFNFNR